MNKRFKQVLPILLVLVVALLIPVMTKNNYYIMLADQAIINIIAVLGLNFITGLTGQVNLGMAGTFAAGAYTSALMSTQLGWNNWIGVFCSVIVGIIVGYVLGYPSLRIRGIYLTLTTIGFGEIMRLLLTNLADITGGTQGVISIPSLSILGYELNTSSKMFYFLLAVLLIMAWMASRIINGKWGRAFKAVRDNDTAVESVGINISKVKLRSFILSSAFTAFAGGLYSHLMGYINPSDFTFDMSTKFLMMLMLGGIGSIAGCIIGGTTITVLPELLRFMQDYYWLVFSVIVLFCIMVLPYGIVSIKDLPIFRKLRKGEEVLVAEGGSDEERNLKN